METRSAVTTDAPYAAASTAGACARVWQGREAPKRPRLGSRRRAARRAIPPRAADERTVGRAGAAGPHRAGRILPAPPAAPARRRGLAHALPAGESWADSDARVFAASRECAERSLFDTRSRVPARWLALPDIGRGCDRTPAESRGRDRQAAFPMSAA